MNSSTQMSLILVWALFRGVLWLSVMHSLVIEYGQKFPTVFKCLVSNTGQNPTKKKTNESKQTNASSDESGIFHPNVCLSPISLNCILVWISWIRMARKILHRMSFSFHQFHNWSKFPWIYLAMSCLSYLGSHQCNRFSLSSLVANIWVLQRFLEIIPSFGFCAYIKGFLSSRSGLDKKFHFDITSAVVTPHIHRQINP